MMEKLLQAVLPLGCIVVLLATLLLPWQRTPAEDHLRRILPLMLLPA